MKKRKENESLEAIIKRKTRVGTAIVAAMFLVLFIAIVVIYLARGISILTAIVDFLVIGLMFCWLTFISYKLRKRTYKRQEIYKYNERKVMNKLSRNKYTKVIPKYRTEFSDDPQSKRSVEFYARLIKLGNEEAVQVDRKYVTESEYVKYDGYLPGYFLDYYEIVEN